MDKRSVRQKGVRWSRVREGKHACFYTKIFGSVKGKKAEECLCGKQNQMDNEKQSEREKEKEWLLLNIIGLTMQNKLTEQEPELSDKLW